jgi:hypothetical protein
MSEDVASKKPEWEKVSEDTGSGLRVSTARLRVTGGYLYRTTTNEMTTSMTSMALAFVPDETHDRTT